MALKSNYAKNREIYSIESAEKNMNMKKGENISLI